MLRRSEKTRGCAGTRKSTRRKWCVVERCGAHDPSVRKRPPGSKRLDHSAMHVHHGLQNSVRNGSLFSMAGCSSFVKNRSLSTDAPREANRSRTRNRRRDVFLAPLWFLWDRLPSHLPLLFQLWTEVDTGSRTQHLMATCATLSPPNHHGSSAGRARGRSSQSLLPNASAWKLPPRSAWLCARPRVRANVERSHE